MTDTLTPGSEWLLPVTFDCDGEYLGPLFKTDLYCIDVTNAELETLIPADRITELEAEVARLQAHVDRFEGLYDAARGDVAEAEMKAERLRIVGGLAGALMTALRTHGYPVSDAHLGNAGEIMSREARDLHLAAVNLRLALDAEGDGQ